ncbi:ectonucleoside triphosphate diphosphohydrolase 8 [Suncus etruscus]|uniref:ectonucleoside triphosphate diphosphohydrolase 8 n=1 Tax=Suncus etruscus TaxID=109475 RepID=UPI002110BF28|nr:ectonucleoside triphosphate diphosphohydrolase 8 [Suncus etruscus]
MGSSCKERAFTTLLVVATLSSLLTLILILVETTTILLPANIKYGVVFDAGSSHTSLFVYQWPADKENDTGVVSQSLVCQVEGPGISFYAHNPAKAGESLRDCLDQALTHIPKDKWQGTPLFLGATAGMRLLSQKNMSQATGIFEAISQVLSESPLDFWGANLLSGQDEGSLGWITINYVLDKLVKYSFTGQWIRPQEGTLVGALDMGGASTQITFLPERPIQDKSTEVTFKLYGSNYSVYTHSYLCYGRDQILNRLLVNLLQQNISDHRLQQPCYHKGYNATLALAPLYESPCVHTTAPSGLPQNLTVEGTGNPEACATALYKLFNFSTCEHPENCAFEGVYQPPVWGQFYAFSNFFYTFKFLNLTSGQSLTKVNTTIWEFCKKPWGQLEAEYPGEKNWLRDYCASGLYILTLLLKGYGFTEDTWSSISFRKQVGNADIGWTLGYMLNQTNRIPAEPPARWQAQRHSIWVASVVWAVLTLLAFLGAAIGWLLWHCG